MWIIIFSLLFIGLAACKISRQNLQKVVPDKATTQNHPNRCCITRKNTKKRTTVQEWRSRIDNGRKAVRYFKQTRRLVYHLFLSSFLSLDLLPMGACMLINHTTLADMIQWEKVWMSYEIHFRLNGRTGSDRAFITHCV